MQPWEGLKPSFLVEIPTIGLKPGEILLFAKESVRVDNSQSRDGRTWDEMPELPVAFEAV